MVPLPCLAACGARLPSHRKTPGLGCSPSQQPTFLMQKCDNPVLALVSRKASQGSFRVRWEGPYQLSGREDPGPLWGSSWGGEARGRLGQSYSERQGTPARMEGGGAES